MNRIREIRKEQKLTLEKLSDKTNLSIGYISHLEKGTRTNPSLKTMISIAKALDREVGEVFKL